MERMGRLFVAAVVFFAVAVVGAPSAWSVTVDVTGGGGMTGGWSDNNGGWSTPSYYVCQVKGVDGSVAFEAMTTTDYRDRVKELPALYKEATAQWSRSKKEALKAGEKFTEKKPSVPAIVKGSKSFREKAEATTAAEKLQAKWDEALARKRAKEEEKADGRGAKEEKPG